MPGKLRVSLVDNFQDFLRLQEFWNRLLEQSDSNNPFLTFEWQMNWWRCFGGRNKLYVLAIREYENSVPIAIAPFMIVKKGIFKVVQFIGTGLSDYLDFIIKERYEAVLFAIFDFLKSDRKNWDVIFLSDILFGESKFNSLSKVSYYHGIRFNHRSYYLSPYLPINGDWESFLATKSSNFRYNLRRKEKRLKKEGIGLKILKIDGREINDQIFEKIVELERNSWKYDFGTAKMQRDKEKQFYAGFLKSFAKNRWLNIWLGYLDNQTVAYLINFDYGNKIWYYNGAYDKGTRNYGVGTIVTHHAVRDAFAEGKLEYDFLRGEESYKSQWTSKNRESFQFLFYKNTPKSFLTYILIFRIRWFLAKYSFLKRMWLDLKRIPPRILRLFTTG